MYIIDLRIAYVTQFLIQRTSGMHSALWHMMHDLESTIKYILW
jgi:hypothetical protein